MVVKTMLVKAVIIVQCIAELMIDQSTKDILAHIQVPLVLNRQRKRAAMHPQQIPKVVNHQRNRLPVRNPLQQKR